MLGVIIYRLSEKSMGKDIWASVMQADERYCYIHLHYMGLEVNGTDKHHCLHGTANRKLADADGLYVKLCRNCHRLLHDKRYHDRDLQILAQLKWQEMNNKSTQDFIDRYGKSYL